MTKLLVEKAQRCYEVQVNARRRKVEYEVGQKGVVECGQLHLGEGLTPKFMSKIGAPFPIVEQVFKDIYKLNTARD